MKWEIDSREYARGEVLYLGPWQVGGAHYDGTTAKTAKDKYRATCDLPGIGRLGLYETRELAKQRVEKAVWSWLDKLPHMNLTRQGVDCINHPGKTIYEEK